MSPLLHENILIRRELTNYEALQTEAHYHTNKQNNIRKLIILVSKH